jgi:protein SCO1/2
MLVLLLGSAGACTRQQEPPKPVRRFELRGEVVRLDHSTQVAVIKHEKIDGWMEAMTMEFPVRDKAEFGKLTDGMRIRATVLVQDLDYWLADIRPE